MFIVNLCSECGVLPEDKTYETVEEIERFGRLSSMTITNHQLICPICGKTSYCLRDYLAAAIHWNKKNPKKKGEKILPLDLLSDEREKILNLLTEMTEKGASPEELKKVADHSLKVIDAERYYRHYKKSYVVNGIEVLQKKYQGQTISVSYTEDQYPYEMQGET